jgi:hypothetical protein
LIDVGKVLTTLYTSDKEYTGNKRLIEQVKEKWRRLAQKQEVTYNDLETLEKENKKLMKKKRKSTSVSVGLSNLRTSPHTLLQRSKWGSISRLDRNRISPSVKSRRSNLRRVISTSTSARSEKQRSWPRGSFDRELIRSLVINISK